MFRALRKDTCKMDEEKAKWLLVNGEYGTLSMVSTEGYGYGVPLNYVYHKGAIFFHCATEGYKLESIRVNNIVSFCVVGFSQLQPEQFTTAFESVIVFGKAMEAEGSEKEEAFVALVDKYCHDFIERGKQIIKQAITKTVIIKIEIAHMTGKAKQYEGG